jgi:MFS family permease
VRARVSTLTAVVALGVTNHILLAGSRVAVSLRALEGGASAATVGVLLALYALLPMFCAVAAGRFSDRVGVRRPMLAGSIGLALGGFVPVVSSGLAVLFVSAVVVGTSFMLFQVALQNATGEIGNPARRTHNFNQLALGYSISGFVGPLLAGFTIDHAGFTACFILLALMPLVPVAVLAAGRLPLPGPRRVPAGAPTGTVLGLLTHRPLRAVFAINVLVAMGWDLHTIIVPIYGAALGLSASQIGLILSSFAAATFLVRVGMRFILRHANEHQVLTLALFIAGAVYMLFPLSHTAPTLMLLSFALGLGLGMGQPMVMSLLHSHAPPGRMGEAAGVRMSLVNSMSVAVPLAFGALGATVGLAPVFWSVGLTLTTGGWLATRGR